MKGWWVVGTNLESGRKLQHRKFPLFLQTASSSSKPPSILRCFICFTILNPFINIYQGPTYIIIIPQPNNCVQRKEEYSEKDIDRKSEPCVGLSAIPYSTSTTTGGENISIFNAGAVWKEEIDNNFLCEIINGFCGRISFAVQPLKAVAPEPLWTWSPFLSCKIGKHNTNTQCRKYIHFKYTTMMKIQMINIEIQLVDYF